MAKKTAPAKEETATQPKGKWLRVGSMLVSKKGGYYLKIEEDIKAGTSIQMQKPQDEVARLVQRGFLTQEQADERLEKIPSFVKFNLVMPPSDDDSNF